MLVLALLGVAMNIKNSNFVSDSDDSDDVVEDIDKLCDVTQSVINTMLRFSIIFPFSITNDTSFVIFPLSTGNYQGKPKLNLSMVWPSFASQGTTLESLVN